MWSLKLFLLCMTLSLYACSMVEKAMVMDEIVPDIIPSAPRFVIKVSYPSGVNITLGNKVGCKEVKDIPRVRWPANPKKFYTLCMIDPDAPRRNLPLNKEWQHWLVVNIPGNNVRMGETLSQYIGAGPPADTGFHRYIFLVYKQLTKLVFDEPHLNNRSFNDRAMFSIFNFAHKYFLGFPVAGNYFQAEFDDYVHVLYKQLYNMTT